MNVDEENAKKLSALRSVHQKAKTSGSVTFICFLTLFYGVRFFRIEAIVWPLCAALPYAIFAFIVYSWSSGMIKRVENKGAAVMSDVTHYRIEQMALFAKILNATYIIFVLFTVSAFAAAYFGWIGPDPR